MDKKESSHLTYEQRLSMSNKTFYLVIEHKYSASIINEWFYRDQSFELRFMKAPATIHNSVMVAVKDSGGNALDFVLWCVSVIGAKPYQIA